MGKDSLLKSTSKKKGPAKKKTAAAAKKTAGQATAKKTAKAPAKKNPGKKSEPKKQAPAVKTAVAAKKSEVKPAAPAVKVSIRDLLKERFERYTPKAPFALEAEALDPQRLVSPPFIDAADPTEAKRLKALLLEKLDLSEMAAAARAARQVAPEAVQEPPAPEAAAAESAPPEPPSESAVPDADASPEAVPPPEPPVDRDVLEGFGGPMPYSKTTIMGIVAFAMLVLLILGASFSNTHKYYLEPGADGLEIWRGAFAPMGREKLLTLPGVQMPAETREVYAKSDVYPLVFDYYLGQADRLLDEAGLPDFEAIKAHLIEARKFAATPEAEKMARLRIDYIDLFVLRYKAEIAAAKGTPEDLDAALGYLNDASRLAVDEAESGEIAKRIETFREQKARLVQEQEARQAELKAAEEAELAAQAAAAGGGREEGTVSEAATAQDGGGAEVAQETAHGRKD